MKTCLIISVLLTATAIAEPVCDDLHVVGWNSAARAHNDPTGWTVIFSGKLIPCDGVVSQWTYWAQTAEPFRAIVWRPTTVDSVFNVVGINDIPAGAINEAVVYTVPKDQRIQVQQGDVIGLGWSDQSPRTTWANDGTNRAEVRWYRDADPTTLQVGDTRSTQGLENRAWSFSALIHSNELFGRKSVGGCIASTTCSCECEC